MMSPRRLPILLVALAALATPAAPTRGGPLARPQPAAAPAGVASLRIDGPHIWIRGDQAEVMSIEPAAPEADDERSTVTRRSLTRDELLATRIPCIVDDAARTRFEIEVRAEHPIAPASWPQPQRLLATSDIEGNFDVLVRILRSQGAVDESLAWSFGANHLVVLGDSVDRGDNVTQVLWLLYRLDGEARRAGGAVHVLLGNHEAMLMRGDGRYIAEKYRQLLAATGLPIEEYFSAESELGRWLRTKHAMVRIGDDLFVHAGIGPRFLERRLSIDETNDLVRAQLGVRRPEGDAGLVLGGEGPLWYRGLVVATDAVPKADAQHVAEVLEAYGVRRVLVAHTLVDRISSDYDGRVVRIDLRHPRSSADGVARALLIEGGASFVVGDDGTKEPLEEPRSTPR